MEPISLILAALIAGAAAAAPTVGGEVIKDAYKGLKELIQRKFANNEKAIKTLADYEEDSETYEKPMAKQLETTGAAQDEEIIKVAQKLMALLEPEQAARGRFNVQVGGNIYGLVQDTKGNVEQTFTFGQSTSNDTKEVE